MRRLYRMRCPSCKYDYQYEGEEFETEHCPICSHQAPFNEFMIDVHLPKPPLWDSIEPYLEDE